MRALPPTAEAALALQRQIGNTAVQRLIAPNPSVPDWSTATSISASTVGGTGVFFVSVGSANYVIKRARASELTSILAAERALKSLGGGSVVATVSRPVKNDTVEAKAIVKCLRTALSSDQSLGIRLDHLANADWILVQDRLAAKSLSDPQNATAPSGVPTGDHETNVAAKGGAATLTAEQRRFLEGLGRMMVIDFFIGHPDRLLKRGGTNVNFGNLLVGDGGTVGAIDNLAVAESFGPEMISAFSEADRRKAVQTIDGGLGQQSAMRIGDIMEDSTNARTLGDALVNPSPLLSMLAEMEALSWLRDRLAVAAPVVREAALSAARDVAARFTKAGRKEERLALKDLHTKHGGEPLEWRTLRVRAHYLGLVATGMSDTASAGENGYKAASDTALEQATGFGHLYTWKEDLRATLGELESGYEQVATPQIARPSFLGRIGRPSAVAADREQFRNVIKTGWSAYKGEGPFVESFKPSPGSGLAGVHLRLALAFLRPRGVLLDKNSQGRHLLDLLTGADLGRYVPEYRKDKTSGDRGRADWPSLLTPDKFVSDDPQNVSKDALFDHVRNRRFGYARGDFERLKRIRDARNAHGDVMLKTIHAELAAITSVVRELPARTEAFVAPWKVVAAGFPEVQSELNSLLLPVAVEQRLSLLELERTARAKALQRHQSGH